MRIKHLAITAGLLLLSAGAASATPALVTGDVNLRSGPGAGFGVLTVLPGGATVNVVDCASGWCRIAWREGYGYASSRYLDLGDGPVYSGPPPGYYAPPPVVTFGFGWGGPRWYGGHYRGRYYGGYHHHH